MSRIADEVAKLDSALQGPTLQLLNHRWMGIVLATCRQAFGHDAVRVPADRLHHQVDIYLDELRTLDFPTPPDASGRDLCVAWVRAKWLNRVPDEAGEAYEVTSHTLAAERIVDSVAEDRPLLSGSRLATFMDLIGRMAADANPNRSQRVDALTADIDRLTAERDRLLAGGAIAAASDDDMLDAYLDATDLMGRFPADFRRIQEDIDRNARQTAAEFRTDTRPKGDILDGYLQRSATLLEGTEAGRAFAGAANLISDDTLMEALRTRLRLVVDHPFSEALEPKERADFLHADRVLRRGLLDVQTQQHKASRALADNLSRADTVRQRELAELLTALGEAHRRWCATSGPRAGLTFNGMPDAFELGRLPDTFHNPGSDQLLAPVEDVSDQAPPRASLEQVRRYGGPLIAEVADAMRARAGQPGTVADAFNTLDEVLRRPVELFGLAQLATGLGVRPDDDGAVDTVTAIRPDGVRRTFTAPRTDLGAAFGNENDKGASDD